MIAGAAASLALPGLASAASLQGLGDLAGGSFESRAHAVSDDGSSVVGSSSSGSGLEAFRWQAGAMLGLGDLSGGDFASEAHGVSADGSVVVGDSTTGLAEVHAFRWQGGSLTDLGQGFLASALDTSADGTVAVGVRALGSTSDPEPEAVRWVGTSLGGLGDLPGGDFSSFAHAVSADGSVVVGAADDGSSSPVGFRWESGTMTALTTLAPGFATLLARGVSNDGAVIVGEDDDPVDGLRGFRLEAGAVTLLTGMRRALGVSADGDTIVGEMGTALAPEAAVWTPTGGTRRVIDVLTEDYNLVGLDGWTLEQAVGISADGQVIAGNGIDPLGRTQAWVVELSPSCGDSLDNDGDGLVDLADPGCDDAGDVSERSPALPCDDFVDGDGDGLADFPDDPGCSAPDDPDETTPSLVCDDGADNDGDGGVDTGGDPGCSDPLDGSERSPVLPCDDGLDNDGDGDVDFPADADCSSSLDASEDAIAGTVLETAKLSDGAGGFGGGLADDEGFGAALAGPGDLDGNGVPDLIVGAPSDGAPAPGTGRLFAVRLDAAAGVVSRTAIDGGAGGVSGPLDAGDFLGRGLAALGDLDGNGVPDVVAGAPGDDDGGSGRGAAWTLLLGPAGAGVLSDVKTSANAGGFAGPLANGNQFGTALAPLGDFDGGGTVDVAVGAPSDADGGFAKGAVWLLERAADGSVEAAHKISATAGGFAGTLDFFDFFGSALAALGDLDGNGVVDLAVGAPRDDDGGPDRGAVWILFLAADGSVASHQKISASAGAFAGPLANGDTFGSALAPLGDLDADGVADLAVGAPGDDDGGPDRGAVWILTLHPDGTVKTQLEINSVQGGLTGWLSDGDAFGSALALVGDVRGSGGDELAVGAPRDDDGGDDRGAVYLLRLDRAVCGDGQLEFEEICDDGNLEGLDGCSALCALQDAFYLSGTAQGGSVSLVVAGVAIGVATSAGQGAAEVLEALAQEIDADPTLSALGVDASSDGSALVVDGALIDSSQVDDPGFAPAFVPSVPALSGAARVLLVALVAAASLRRAARPAPGGRPRA